MLAVRRYFNQALPTPLVGRLKRLRQVAMLSVLRLAGTSPVLNLLFYSAASRAFRREQLGVAYGRWKYEQATISPERSEYMLRRNIHQLEKGIISRPRRDLFALDYIQATVSAYEERLRDAGCDVAGEAARELQWASDVLTNYFAVVGSHPAVDEARARFRALPSPSERKVLAPYKRSLDEPPPVSYDALLQLAHRRRSVRWFLPKPVPREMIDAAMEVAALSPSACNRQPFHFRIFDEPELVQQVSSLPAGTAGFNQNFPVIVAVVGSLRAYFDERDRHIIYIDGGLASMSFVLALESLGLSSCCINWPDVESRERKMASVLKLEPDQRVVMLIAVGYPDPEGMVPASGKKSLASLRSYNHIPG
jgi:nitroreductase